MRNCRFFHASLPRKATSVSPIALYALVGKTPISKNMISDLFCVREARRAVRGAAKRSAEHGLAAPMSRGRGDEHCREGEGRERRYGEVEGRNRLVFEDAGHQQVLAERGHEHQGA